MIAAAIVDVLVAAAPSLLAACAVSAVLAAIALVFDRRAVRVERAAGERWHDAGMAIDDILEEAWPEAAAVTGPIEVVITGPTTVIPPEPLAPLEACAHLSTLDRLDGLRCPTCDPR